MNTTAQHQGNANNAPRRSNAYVPPATAKRREAAPAAIEAPGASLAEAVPIFKVGYRKVRSTSIVFPDRRVRCVTPKFSAMEAVADKQEVLLAFADPELARRQPIRMLNEAKAVLRDIVPYMVPDEGDRQFLLDRFDDEKVEETELIVSILKAFAYLMGTLTGAQAAETPAPPAPPAPREPEAATDASPDAPAMSADEFSLRNNPIGDVPPEVEDAEDE